MTSPLKLGRTTAEPPPTQPQQPQPGRQPGPGPKPAGPTHPTPSGPPNRSADAQILSVIDDQLIALLALAHFGPAEQCTAKSVGQVSAAEVLLFRLRSARKAVAELREALDLPARQVPLTHARVSDDTASVPGGLGPNVPGGSDSEGSRPGRNGRAVGADGAATFANPNSRVPLKFEEGTDHLIGAARPALIPQLVGDAVYDAQRRRQLSNP